MVGGLSSAKLGIPEYHVALDQHLAFIKALVQCGIEVAVLPADPRFLDSAFVEDPALLIGRLPFLPGRVLNHAGGK